MATSWLLHVNFIIFGAQKLKNLKFEIIQISNHTPNNTM